MESGRSDDDLPLSANIKEIRARHYIMILLPNIELKIVNVKLFIVFDLPSKCERLGNVCQRKCGCEKIENENFNLPKNIFLDANSLLVSQIFEVSVSKTELEEFTDPMKTKKNVQKLSYILSLPKQELKFDLCKDYLDINLKMESTAPILLEINYQSTASGDSLSWGKTSEGFECIFTAGTPLNNRSLLPCQDAPGAMATWEACILMKNDEHHVSMTGDEIARKITNSNMLEDLFKPFVEDKNLYTFNCVAHYFYSSLVLPIATIALAIGKWSSRTLSYPMSLLSNLSQSVDSADCEHFRYVCQVKNCIPINSIPLTVVHEQSLEEYMPPVFDFLPYCTAAAVDILGPYPCPRVEFVILPQSFSSLGLASPNIISLNPSVITSGDSFTFLRVCHEICHAWFGIIIGPEDWTQEWLSEGFATFLEEAVYNRAVTLYNQSNHSSSSGLTPRPVKLRKTEKYVSRMDTFTDLSIEAQTNLRDIRDRLKLRSLRQEEESASPSFMTLVPPNNHLGESVAHALSRDKMHLKVHYLKGYFLLKFLSSVIGESNFLNMLKRFILIFHGQLISSKDFIDFTFSRFSSVLTISKDDFVSKWLTSSALGECDFMIADDNVLYDDCMELVRIISKQGAESDMILNPVCGPDQLQIFLELLIDEEGHLPQKIMRNIYEFYEIERRNCEVRHSWCELIIKQNYKKGISSVRRFLSTEFAMGVYLYGELMITRKAHWIKLAKEIYVKTSELMDDSTRKTVREMIFTS